MTRPHRAGNSCSSSRGAPDAPADEQDEQDRLAAAADEVRRRMAAGETQKDAVKAVSAAAGVKKNALYRYVLETDGA